MNDADDLKELVQKAAAGDGEAFEELYRETCRSVYFTCHNILKDEQEAQDVTQDVYLTAFEQLGTLEDAGKFKPWLYRIAANKSIKRLKKKQPILLDDEQLEDMETEDNENFLPEEYALNADKRKLVLDITRKVCTEAQYQTILLYYFNELSIAEIAEIMECQEGNVKKRLSIARAKIKEGVLRYEKKSGDKLYSVAVIPFLTALFTAQMQDMQMPSLPLSFLGLGARPKSTLAAQTAKTGGRIMLKGLQLKIAVGIAAVVLIGGVAAAVIITNHNAQEASAGVQGESALDVADAGNTEDMDTSSESDAGETEPDEDTLQAETETAPESEATGDSEPTEDTENEENEAEEEPEATEGAATTAGSEQQYTYTDMSATMYASQTVNVRDLPSTDGNRVGGLSTNQEVNVTGQCNETGWYRFDYNGSTAYVSNNYLSDSKVEVSSQSASSGGDSSNNAGKEPCPYPLNVWTAQTTEYGLKIYVIYTTKNNLTDILWTEPLAENHYLFDYYDEVGNSIFVDEIYEQWHNLLDSTGIRYGLHFVYPIVKVGTYAEGTVYKCSAGGHYDSYIDNETGLFGCDFNRTTAQPGKID